MPPSLQLTGKSPSNSSEFGSVRKNRWKNSSYLQAVSKEWAGLKKLTGGNPVSESKNEETPKIA